MYHFISIVEPETTHLTNIVVPIIASQWESVAVNLQLEDFRINVIKEQGNENSQDCCRQLLTEWADTTADGTWETLLNAVKHVDNSACDEIRQHLSNLKIT